MIERPNIRKILYCTDLGKHAAPVFVHSLSIADQNSAKVTVFHCVEPMSDTAKTVLETYVSDSDLIKIQQDGMEKVFKYMKKRIANFLHQELNATMEDEPINEIRVVSGNPCEEILRIAEEECFDLIVMGKSSKSVMGNKTMGSVTRHVTRFSKVPVLVVPNR